MSTLTTGQELPEQAYTVTRADLVRYAGASGDFNSIHWSDRVAGSVGLPGVIAHGMFTMALAARALDTWAGASSAASSPSRWSCPTTTPASRCWSAAPSRTSPTRACRSPSR